MERSAQSKTLSKYLSRDPHVPQRLLETQEWLGSLIAQAIHEDNRLPPLTPSGALAVEECPLWVAPSPTLAPHERVEIYHQQYWWRLLKCLQTNFPMVTRLFGEKAFNQQIGVPYLACHPPSHWALCTLGHTLPEWIHAYYVQEDQNLIEAAAQIDWAAGKGFWEKDTSPIDFSTLTQEETLSLPLSLQSHVSLFSLPADLFSFRDALLKEEADFWNTHPFPELKYGEGQFVLYRAKNQLMTWKKISFAEYYFLTLFIQGLTINQACEKIEENGGEVYEEALIALPIWFRDWTALGWITSFS